MNQLQIYSIAKLQRIKLARTDFLIFASGIIKECFQTEAVMSQRWILSATYELEQVLNGDAVIIEDDIEKSVSRIIVNASPRMGKTTLLPICGILYEIGKFPNRKHCLLTASSAVLAKFSSDINTGIESEFFKEVFPYFKLKVNNVGKKQTTEGGLIDFKTAGSSITGGGYNYLWFDDFINPKDLKSDAKMSTMVDNLKIALGRKEYSPRTKVIVVEQKLLGNVNITDTLISLWKGVIPYKHLEYPYQYEERTEYDWHFGEKLVYNVGDFVDVKFNEIDKQEIIATRGVDIFLREYMCKTIILGNIIIKREYFGRYGQDDLQWGVKSCFITTDFAFSTKRASNNTVFCCWGVTEDNKLLLLDMEVFKSEISEGTTKLHTFYAKWKNPANRYLSPARHIFIEEGIHMNATIEYFTKCYGGVIKTIKRHSDKFSRYQQVAAFIENADGMYIKRGGNVLLPNNSVQIEGRSNNEMEIVEPLLSECERFTSTDDHKLDDMVDNLIDAMTEVFVNSRKSSIMDDLNRFNAYNERRPFD